MPNNTCPIVSVCGLKSLLDEALEAFIGTLDKYTLSDLIKEKSRHKFIQLVGH